jgi:hypothetical protein
VPAVTAQMQLRQAMNEGAAVRSQVQLQHMLNQRPSVVAQAKLAQTLSNTPPIQREAMPEEDELLQAKFQSVQRQEADVDALRDLDDEETLQGQFTPGEREVTPDEDELLQTKLEPAQRETMTDEDELLQAKSKPVQRQGINADALGEVEEEEMLQGKLVPVQREAMPDEDEPVQRKREPVQRQENNQTGLPDTIKSGVENLSGLSLDDVRVHYNSAAPATLQAAAYAQGTDIHVAPGQEQHLPHEAWHIVQQKQGRVQPTLQARDVAINDDVGLEKEADVMGAKALQMAHVNHATQPERHAVKAVRQRRVYQRVSAGGVLQLIYLWDRAQEAAPHWDDREQPPEDYLASGRHNDGTHGEDNLYARLGEHDLFYGLNYDNEEHEEMMDQFLAAIQEIGTEIDIDVEKPDGFTAALRLYEARGGEPLLDVQAMKSLYSGSSGWDRYQPYLPEGGKAETGQQLAQLNPALPWADADTERAGFACQVAMVEAIRSDGSVRFILDGMRDIRGIIEKTSNWSTNVTSHELRFALKLLDQPINVAEDEVVTPVDGSNVFFYLNRKLVSATDVPDME